MRDILNNAQRGVCTVMTLEVLLFKRMFNPCLMNKDR